MNASTTPELPIRADAIRYDIGPLHVGFGTTTAGMLALNHLEGCPEWLGLALMLSVLTAMIASLVLHRRRLGWHDVSIEGPVMRIGSEHGVSRFDIYDWHVEDGTIVLHGHGRNWRLAARLGYEADLAKQVTSFMGAPPKSGVSIKVGLGVGTGIVLGGAALIAADRYGLRWLGATALIALVIVAMIRTLYEARKRG